MNIQDEIRKRQQQIAALEDEVESLQTALKLLSPAKPQKPAKKRKNVRRDVPLKVQVLNLLSSNKEEIITADVAGKALGISRNHAQVLLSELVKTNQSSRLSKGRYQFLAPEMKKISLQVLADHEPHPFSTIEEVK